MIIVISGANRVEFCKVTKKSDFSRRFFMTRGQLYFVPTNGLKRMRVREFGKERPSEAVIAYEENEIKPYDTCGLTYCMDNMLADIDRYKEMTDYSWFRQNKPYITSTVTTLWKYLTAPGGIVLVVLAWVFLTRGF